MVQYGWRALMSNFDKGLCFRAQGKVSRSQEKAAEMHGRKRGAIEPAMSPRLVSREKAAAYCDLSVQAFSAWTKAGRLPPSLPGTARWDLRAIDHALDSLSGIRESREETPLDDWRSRRARRSERNS
jgi:hypothetical protein